MCQVLVNGVYENTCGIIPLNDFVYGFAWGMITVLVLVGIIGLIQNYVENKKKKVS